MGSFLNRPIDGVWPDRRLDATDLKVRPRGLAVSMAAIIACGVNPDGRLEILGRGRGEPEPIPEDQCDPCHWLGCLEHCGRNRC
ncbi:transposase [Methylococcus capsulatus]|uniref:transposase n=1 Tax=Methylococcus capsulatus TaxID=414 RepID=UPI0018E03B6F